MDNYSHNSSRASPRRFYSAAWRWHFYAGIYVIPFILMSALTGMIMMYSDFFDNWHYRELLTVETQAGSISASRQLELVQEAYPETQVTRYRIPRSSSGSSEFTLTPSHGMGAAGEHTNSEVLVFVNPYDGKILGSMDTGATLYSWAHGIHGTFFMGSFGNYLIEIAAGLAVLLVASGLFMWWPRGNNTRKWTAALVPAINLGKGRLAWRDLHASLGAWLSIAMLFFLISGLSWTNVWGGQFVQAWSSVQSEAFAGPVGDSTHAAMNRGDLAEVPWSLEQSPMPVSGSAMGEAGIESRMLTGTLSDLDTVITFARAQGFDQFRVHIPTHENAVWTLAATMMAEDVQSPGAERILHIDRYSGNILADISFADYPLMGKAMSAGVPMHQGDLGTLNLVFNTLFCLSMITLSVAALIMWWKRRPLNGLRLAPPPLPRDMKTWQGAVLLMFTLSLLFPLTALCFVFLIVMDYLFISKMQFMRTILK